jgi:hypothetical protein
MVTPIFSNDYFKLGLQYLSIFKFATMKIIEELFLLKIFCESS